MGYLDLAGEAQGIADALVAAGIRASVDPADLDTPCVWVTFEGIVQRHLDGSGHITFVLYLIVGDKDTLRAMSALTALLADVVKVIPPDDVVRPANVVLPGSPHPLPALSLPRTLKVAVTTEGSN